MSASAREILDPGRLNRALMARQLLLRRSDLEPAGALSHLLGVHAQVPNDPYVALWSRLEGFEPEVLSVMLTDRQAVRIALMRSTLHLVTADDALALRSFVQPVLDRDLYRNSTHGPAVADLDTAALVAEGRRLLDAAPLTAGELGALLQESRPDRRPASLGYAVRNLVPLVQVPPRGLWGASGKPRHATAEAWLGAGGDAGAAEPAQVVRRYLAAFGPATVKDVQSWCGLTRLREVLESIRAELVTFEDDRGRELFDLPDAPRPHAGVPVPPRFLPEYDNVFLGHENRERIIPDGLSFAEYSRTWGFFMSARGGILRGNLLLDGYLRGVWRASRVRRDFTLEVDVFTRLSPPQETAVAHEGERLLALVAERAGSVQVVVREAKPSDQ